MKYWLRVFCYFQRDAWRLVVVLVLMLASTAANLLKPWPLALIVDSVLGSKPWPGWLASWVEGLSKAEILVGGTVLIVVLHAIQGGLSTIYNYLSIKVGLRGLRQVRNEVFACLQRLSWRFHEGSKAGDLIYRASWDTYAFQTAFQQGLVTAVTALLSLTLMIVIMARLNWALTLVALGTLPLLLLSIQFFGRVMRDRGTTAQQADSQVTSLVQQNITALPLIQSYTREEAEQKRFTSQTAVAQEKRLSQHAWELLYGFGITLVFGLGTAATIWIGSGQVLANHLTVGELLIFIAYLAQLYEPLSQLSHVGAAVSTARASTQRIFEILDTPEDVKDTPTARHILATEAQPIQTSGQVANTSTPLIIRGQVSFENVAFSYQPEHPVLKDLNLTVPVGQSVAIVGPSGAGKSTLLKLIPRFYDPTAGTVRLDGVDLREVCLKDLRAQIALVFQESILLSATIAENIALGRPNATATEIENAARAANAHDFIQRLPGKYETPVGEGATRLSVGETQRIGLARAYLKDAPILLLDEPTSALDAESEQLILASLIKLMQGRTTLIVTHRLNTIRGVDKLVVLGAGRVLEEGSPMELLNRPGGYFARLSLQDGAGRTDL